MSDFAQRVFVATLVAVGVVVAVLALWKLKVVIALVFLAFILAAAMRPGVEALRRRRIPRGVGIGLHYLALAGGVGLLLWLVVPRAVDQVQAAIGGDEIASAASRETGWKHDALVSLDRWLNDLPQAGNVVSHALDATVLGFEIVIGIFFVLASAAYWIFERERAERLVLRLVPPRQRRVVRDTWKLIDLKLGAYVHGLRRLRGAARDPARGRAREARRGDRPRQGPGAGGRTDRPLPGQRRRSLSVGGATGRSRVRRRGGGLLPDSAHGRTGTSNRRKSSWRARSARRTFFGSQALRQRPKTRPPRVKPMLKAPTANAPTVAALRAFESRCQRPSASSSSIVSGSPRRFFRNAPPARRPR
ncbi:MAG TPA: AI-2E family transporter [Gaiellaceae bacterium]|nr:AI-2E family transporter [Gaiellaceae bacterium]